MKNNTFAISYPHASGFKKTVIAFHSGTPDIASLFYQSKQVGTSPITAHFFVTDKTIASLPSVAPFVSLFSKAHDAPSQNWTGTKGNDVLLILGAGESFKTMESVLAIEKTALFFNFDRHATFVAIGGGVICDMTGFAASIFKRGVSIRFIPTTLLAMVDASLGGKTGCDFEGYKNMVGAFWPATQLDVWSSFVQTLPEHEYRSGLAEAVKTALLFSKRLCFLFEKEHDRISKRDDEILSEIIFTCAKEKARVVEKDFREQNIRALLNYGHTFGHALESVAGLGKVTHGDAVAWGIGRALDLSCSLGKCDVSYVASTKAMLASYGWDMNAVPSAVANEKSPSLLLQAMHKDKKNSSSTKIRVIMQTGLCRNVITEVDEAEILPVLQK